MAKEILAQVKIQITGGKATPAPPVGTALGPHGIDMNSFVTQFNEQTREQTGTVIPVEVTIFKDRSFVFILKSPPAAVLIKEAIKKEKGAADPKKENIGTLKQSDLEAIAQKKMDDLSARTIEKAKRIIAGTARSMGVAVEE